MKNSNKKIVMCGCHEGGIKPILGLLEAGYKFDKFVCLDNSQARKYSVSGFYDFREIADKYNIEVYTPKAYSLKTDQDNEFFKLNNFDLLIQGGWQRLFPDEILKNLKIGALGLHGSSDLLPKGRGRSPMNWSLIENKKRFLMHLFMISPGVDDGDIIAVDQFDINEFDDINTLYFKYSLIYKKLLLENIRNILNGDIENIPQVGEPSYYKKRTEEDGFFNWEDKDIYQIYNFVRGQTKPYPGATTLLGNRKIKIWKCRPFDTRMIHKGNKYGEIIEKFGSKLIINCRGGLLLIDDWEYLNV